MLKASVVVFMVLCFAEVSDGVVESFSQKTKTR